MHNFRFFVLFFLLLTATIWLHGNVRISGSAPAQAAFHIGAFITAVGLLFDYCWKVENTILTAKQRRFVDDAFRLLVLIIVTICAAILTTEAAKNILAISFPF